jgi:hypothetical protein
MAGVLGVSGVETGLVTDTGVVLGTARGAAAAVLAGSEADVVELAAVLFLPLFAATAIMTMTMMNAAKPSPILLAIFTAVVLRS